MWVKLSIFISKYLGFIGFLLIAAFAYWYIQKRKKHHKEAVAVYKKAIEKNMHEPHTMHPRIDPKLCAGCSSCVKACPEGEIIKLINHKAVLVTPTKCVGHGECEVVCPYGAIDLVFGTKTRGMDIPRISKNYETNVPGLYIAGELGGMGLIRNAIKQGVLASEHALNQSKKVKAATDVDLLIIGAGPAGIAASLKAKEMGLPYVCIDQDSLGGAVYNFPKQKVVMSQPAELPLVGVMKFRSHKVSKEELLKYWENLRKHFKLNIKEKVKFTGLDKKGDVFSIETSRGNLTAKKVILALGVRGSPRKLGLENEELSKVTYNLLDPDQYQGQYVAVVGGGNAGVEAAQYLAKAKLKNKVLLLVRGAAMDRANEENQNIIMDMEKQGLVKIWYNTSVTKIEKDSLEVNKAGEKLSIPNNFLFIFAGAIMPHKFLMDLGIKIEKKFGEALK